MVITDFHAHAFPDSLAGRAIAKIEEQSGGAKAFLDGKISSLLASMDRAGVGRSVICSIATRPEQFRAIVRWSGEVASDRIIPLPSVHPRDPDALEHLAEVKAAGFKGIKLHPYYQDYVLDEEMMFPLYERISQLGLILVSHTGFDIAFPRVRRADPERISRVISRFPELKLVTTHLGSWQDWDNVRKFLLGKPVCMEISYSLGQLRDDEAKQMLLRHPQEYLMFGTDSPWQDQAETLRKLRALNLGKEREQAILSGNADRLLSGA